MNKFIRTLSGAALSALMLTGTAAVPAMAAESSYEEIAAQTIQVTEAEISQRGFANAVQSALGFLSLADIPLPEFANTIIFWSGEALIWISTVFAVISGVIYLKQNWKFIENI